MYSISFFICINPNFSYKGLPISVASREIEVIPLFFASSTSKASVLMAIPFLRYKGFVYIFIIYAFLPLGL